MTQLLDAMLLVDTADEMYEVIREALAGHDWFDCWDSINEAATLATKTILAAGPPIMDYRHLFMATGWEIDRPTLVCQQCGHFAWHSIHIWRP